MKSIPSKNITGLLLMLLFIFTNCSKDLSTLDVNKLPDISVDTTGQSTLNIFQFDELKLRPKIIASNLNDHKLSYEWRINIEPRSLEYVTIGTEEILSYEVSFAPTTPTHLHQVLLTITDENTGIKYLQNWPLSIRNSIGEGLVIAETYDGVNADISHLMTPLVTPDYSDEKIRHKIYSGVNGTTIPGLIKTMMYTRFGNLNVMLSSTDNSLFTINTLDYQLGVQNEKLFYAEQASYGAAFMAAHRSPQNDIIISKEKMYVTWLQLTRFGLPSVNSYKIPNIVAVNAHPGSNINLNFYSEDKGHFAFQPSFGSFGDRNMRAVPSFAGVFNPNSVVNKANVAAGVSSQGDFLHVLKDKTSNKFELYVLDQGGYDNINYEVIPSKPKRFVDLSGAPEIDQAIHFVLLDDQSVLLYATKTKIYAAIYSASTPSYGIRYTVAQGEEITTLKTYYQADYPHSSRTYFERNGKQLILSTYNGTEGKVHILPLVNQGIANIDQANIKTYGGFGKILFTTTQL